VTARVSVLLTPGEGAVPARATAVVVDVLRASSVLTVARAHGAGAIVAAGTPEEAVALRGRLPGALLCGERDGRKLPGFDLGNSPFEYDAATVAGRTLVFASTNGSRALRAAARARRVVLGAFVNASAVLEAVAADDEIAVVCAGKLGGFALEDAACAGWLAARLAARGARVAGGAAAFARGLAPRDVGDVHALVQGSAHGRYLRSLGPGYARDVEFCAGLDTLGGVFGP
jgi:2-phosphosulfolactate phosphatase